MFGGFRPQLHGFGWQENDVYLHRKLRTAKYLVLAHDVRRKFSLTYALPRDEHEHEKFIADHLELGYRWTKVNVTIDYA